MAGEIALIGFDCKPFLWPNKFSLI